MQRGKSSKNAIFRGKPHDSKILRVAIVATSYRECHRFPKTPFSFHERSGEYLPRSEPHASMHGRV